MYVTPVQSFKVIAENPMHDLIIQTCHPALAMTLKNQSLTIL